MEKWSARLLWVLFLYSSSCLADGYYKKGAWVELDNVVIVSESLATATTKTDKSVSFSNEIIIKTRVTPPQPEYFSGKYPVQLLAQRGNTLTFKVKDIRQVLSLCKTIFENEPVVYVQPSFGYRLQTHAMAFDRDIVERADLKKKQNDSGSHTTNNHQIMTTAISADTSMLDGQGSVNYYKYFDDVFRYEDESFWHIHNRGGFIAQAYYQGEFIDLLAVEDVDSNIIQVIDDGITGKGVRVAVVDSAFQLDHPDLRFTGSFNFYNASRDVSPNSNADFHGTSVAGVIAANRGNNYGIMGVAPDAYLYLYNGLFDIESDEIFTSAYIDIFLQAAADGIDIMNCSWSSTTSIDEAMEDAINTYLRDGRNGKGGLVVFSSGNDSTTSLNSEAALPGVISVGSIEADGSRSLYSNFGSDLDLVAPTNFVSLDLSGEDGFEPGEMGFVAGTSFAAPVVSGVIALMLEANPALTADQVKDILYSTAKKVGSGTFYNGRFEYRYQYDLDNSTPYNTYYSKSPETGYGLVDAQAAVVKARHYATDNEDVDSTTTLLYRLENTLISGWNFLGTNTAIYDFDIFDNVSIVWCMIDGEWYGYSSSLEYARSLRQQNKLLTWIPANSGIFVYVE
jgi:subtilisin family serine protease